MGSNCWKFGHMGRFTINVNFSMLLYNGRSNSGERISANGIDDKRLDEIYGGRSLAPKHIPIPAVPVDGKLSFEALSLVVSIIAACLQLLNLYRTVWWLPNSYNGRSMVRCTCAFITYLKLNCTCDFKKNCIIYCIIYCRN